MGMDVAFSIAGSRVPGRMRQANAYLKEGGRNRTKFLPLFLHQ
jgi:hypothetical protein